MREVTHLSLYVLCGKNGFMTKVKICGITNLEDALLSAKFGADMLGFNFFKGSSRYINPPEAESIVEQLTIPVVKVGVFVNETIDEILDAEGIAELDAIQLHGDESPEFVKELRVETDAKILKAFHLGSEFDPNVIGNYLVDGILLDTYSANERGGTGRSFDWRIAKTIASSFQRVYLAGGLNPENIAVAIGAVRPYGVDVASGVESSKGKKDAKKLEAFIKNAKNA